MEWYAGWQSNPARSLFSVFIAALQFSIGELWSGNPWTRLSAICAASQPNDSTIVRIAEDPIQHGDSAKRKLTDFFGAIRTPKPVDCPSETVANGNIDCLDSRRAWENSQRGCCFCGIWKAIYQLTAYCVDLWHCICAILLMQSVRDVLRQRAVASVSAACAPDAIRAGCAEAKRFM